VTGVQTCALPIWRLSAGTRHSLVLSQQGNASVTCACLMCSQTPGVVGTKVPKSHGTCDNSHALRLPRWAYDCCRRIMWAQVHVPKVRQGTNDQVPYLPNYHGWKTLKHVLTCHGCDCGSSLLMLRFAYDLPFRNAYVQSETVELHIWGFYFILQTVRIYQIVLLFL